MLPERILETLRGEIGTAVSAAEQSIARRTRRMAAAATICVVCLASVVASSTLFLASKAEAAQAPPIVQIVAGIRELPTGSPTLACFSRALVSCSIELDEDSTVAAISSVGRSGLGLEVEPFLRAALLSPSANVRREAVIWYPVAHPGHASDPVGGPIYEQARLSLAGN